MSFVPPTEEEKEAVIRLKTKIFEEAPDEAQIFTDTAILRFYRGRKQDEEKAYRALQKHLEWRKNNHVNMIDEKVELFEKELTSGKIVVDGVDHHGRPAVFIYARKHNKNDRDLEAMKYLIIYTLEKILKKANPEEERIMICFDLNGFSYSCMDYDVVKLLVEILQFNYPDTLHVALVINAPFIFSACWVIIRPWLDPVTAAKALFVKKEQLLEYFPAENIPEELSPKK